MGDTFMFEIMKTRTAGHPQRHSIPVGILNFYSKYIRFVAPLLLLYNGNDAHLIHAKDGGGILLLSHVPY